jgi:hypothetical protein
LTFTEEGDDCVLNGQGQPVHEAVCGPGLWCMKEEDSNSATCVPSRFHFLMTEVYLRRVGNLIHSTSKSVWLDVIAYVTMLHTIELQS